MYDTTCSYCDCRWERKFIFEEVITSYKKYCLQRCHAAVVICKHTPDLSWQRLWMGQAICDLHCSVQTPPCSYFSSKKKKISYYFWPQADWIQKWKRYINSGKETEKCYCFYKQNPHASKEHSKGSESITALWFFGFQFLLINQQSSACDELIRTWVWVRLHFWGSKPTYTQHCTDISRESFTYQAAREKLELSTPLKLTPYEHARTAASTLETSPGSNAKLRVV